VTQKTEAACGVRGRKEPNNIQKEMGKGRPLKGERYPRGRSGPTKWAERLILKEFGEMPLELAGVAKIIAQEPGSLKKGIQRVLA